MAAAREKLQSLLDKNRILEQDCPGPAIFNICVISGNLFNSFVLHFHHL